MPDVNLGEASYWIMTASALLVRRAKYGSEEYTAAMQALASLTRLQDEIRSLNEQLERRAVAEVPATLIPAMVTAPARARTPTRTPGPVAGSLPSEDRVGGST